MWTLIITLLVGQPAPIKRYEYETRDQCLAALMEKTGGHERYAAVCVEPVK